MAWLMERGSHFGALKERVGFKTLVKTPTLARTITRNNIRVNSK
jgi:hypothetical protein